LSRLIPDEPPPPANAPEETDENTYASPNQTDKSAATAAMLTAVLAPEKDVVEGVTLFHGTDAKSGINLLNGEELNAAKAAANKLDGPPGFFLATHADDAAYFAARREGFILQYNFSPTAVKQLGGLTSTPLGALGKFGSFVGGEVVIAPGSFDLFNSLVQSGEITVIPMR